MNYGKRTTMNEKSERNDWKGRGGGGAKKEGRKERKKAERRLYKRVERKEMR